MNKQELKKIYQDYYDITQFMAVNEERRQEIAVNLFKDHIQQYNKLSNVLKRKNEGKIESFMF